MTVRRDRVHMTDSSGRQDSPLFEAKRFGASSVFTPESLLGEARREKDLPDSDVPDVCVLDPDGDIVRYLTSTGRAEEDPTWPGYHTDLYRFQLEVKRSELSAVSSVHRLQYWWLSSCSRLAVSSS